MAKIKLENGYLLTMSQLQIGNQVQTGIFHCKILIEMVVILSNSIAENRGLSQD